MNNNQELINALIVENQLRLTRIIRRQNKTINLLAFSFVLMGASQYFITKELKGKEQKQKKGD